MTSAHPQRNNPEADGQELGAGALSKRGWILMGSAVPLIALFALLGWALARSGGNPSGFGVNSELGEVAVASERAWEFSLSLLDGGTLALADLRGKVVMVDFWASWCPPCRIEAPVLAKVYREYAGQPVEFVGVDIWDARQDARQFISKYGVSYPSGVDAEGTIAINYGVRGIPEKFFIDREGILVKKIIGPVDEATLRETLDELLGADATEAAPMR